MKFSATLATSHNASNAIHRAQAKKKARKLGRRAEALSFPLPIPHHSRHGLFQRLDCTTRLAKRRCQDRTAIAPTSFQLGSAAVGLSDTFP